MNKPVTRPIGKGENRPLYAQIAAVFEAEIRSGALKPGERLPSQTEVMQAYGVSQSTVRQALLNLSNQGLVIAQQGRGVFVAEPRVTIEMSRPDFISSGRSISYQLINCEVLFAPVRMAELLEVPPGANITRCRRKVLSGERLVGLETSNIPLDVMEVLSQEDLKNHNLQQVLAGNLTFRAVATEYRLYAGFISAFDADLLDVSTEQVVMQYVEVARDANQRPVLMTRSVYLADLASLSGYSALGGGA